MLLASNSSRIRVAAPAKFELSKRATQSHAFDIPHDVDVSWNLDVQLLTDTIRAMLEITNNEPTLSGEKILATTTGVTKLANCKAAGPVIKPAT